LDIVAMAFSRDSQHFAVSSSSLVRIFDVATGRQVAKTFDNKAYVSAMAFSLSGDVVYCAMGGQFKDLPVNAWHCRSGELERVLIENSVWEHPAAVSPDGRFLVTASPGDVQCRAIGEAHRVVWRQHLDGLPASLALSPDGRYAAVGDGIW